jgi:hypothetical protein
MILQEEMRAFIALVIFMARPVVIEQGKYSQTEINVIHGNIAKEARNNYNVMVQCEINLLCPWFFNIH